LHIGTKGVERRQINYGKTDGQSNGVGTTPKFLLSEFDSTPGADPSLKSEFIKFWGEGDRYEDREPRGIGSIRMMKVRKINLSGKLNN
jgi:hypothetical protein